MASTTSFSHGIKVLKIDRGYNAYGTWNDGIYDDGYYRNYDIFSGQPLTRAQKIAMDQCYRTMEQEQKQRESQAKRISSMYERLRSTENESTQLKQQCNHFCQSVKNMEQKMSKFQA